MPNDPRICIHSLPTLIPYPKTLVHKDGNQTQTFGARLKTPDFDALASLRRQRTH